MSHIHFELEGEPGPPKRAQTLNACAGADPHHARGVPMTNQECRSAARTIARDFRYAAVGIVELDGAFGVGIEWRRDEHPTVRTHARVAVADSSRDGRKVGLGCVGLPGEEEVIHGAVSFGERDFHYWFRG